ncbi:ASI1-immunoprecipitated protein 2-like isoform X1 [Rosa rugosa]|uniref:ASI1-immunoprecipitated protein 2-like isoform X1 n=1 Tax=Rosa rugosa TaxID=74645 RepID=UPI002B404046|nr:ASI1-immunoprecipitated protein 2-like isoform X1 [Rosa rugosa]
MVTVCLTCGDRGFEKVTVNCSKCQDSPQHIYCLDVTPEKYFEKDFAWVCDECKPVSIPSKSHHNQNSKKKKRKKLKKKSNRKKFTGSVAKTKVQICEGSPPEHEAKGSENCDNVLKIGNRSGQVLEDQVNSSHDLAASLKTPQIAASDPLKINEDCYVAAQPIIDPTWRGSLSIMNKDFSIISGLVAHLSSLACAKVFEEAKLLPMLLFPDLVCRVDVWPKAFESCGPSDQSIALYFFPDSKSNEKDFDNLVVSMIQEDLAMRAVLDNAELLVFTSSVLPKQFQRFQTKLYLWGAFRGKQSSPLTNDNAPRGEKDLTKPLPCCTQSPVSPLSNNVDCRSESH